MIMTAVNAERVSVAIMVPWLMRDNLSVPYTLAAGHLMEVVRVIDSQSHTKDPRKNDCIRPTRWMAPELATALEAFVEHQREYLIVGCSGAPSRRPRSVATVRALPSEH